MQLVDADGKVLSIWTAEQYAQVCKFARPPKNQPVKTPFTLDSGEQMTCTAASFMHWLRDAHDGFAVMLDSKTVTTADKIQIYQAGLLVMILLDKMERANFVPWKPLVWKVEELPRHATY